MNRFKWAPCGRVFSDIINYWGESYRELENFIEQTVALAVEEGTRASRLWQSYPGQAGFLPRKEQYKKNDVTESLNHILNLDDWVSSQTLLWLELQRAWCSSCDPIDHFKRALLKHSLWSPEILVNYLWQLYENTLLGLEISTSGSF